MKNIFRILLHPKTFSINVSKAANSFTISGQIFDDKTIPPRFPISSFDRNLRSLPRHNNFLPENFDFFPNTHLRTFELEIAWFNFSLAHAVSK